MLLPLECCRERVSPHGFTLVEVVITIGIVALLVYGTISGYVFSANRAEWSAYSMAAHSLAMQGIEQARAAKWDPQAWPVADELGETNYVQMSVLDVPVKGTPVYATNYVSISTVSTNPQLRELRTDCVWSLNERGPFTNSIVTLRAPDQ
jgi:prepilin-type N-terminal cleavage/methylation domain-containing protein